MIELSENETHVLETLYRGWRHHQQTIVTESDLMRRLVFDGFDSDALVPMESLTKRGLLTWVRPQVIMLTEAGIAEGLRRNL